jgi:hypothetical protein
MGTAGRRWVMQEHGRGHLAALVADLVTECMGVCPPVPARHSRGS